MSHQASCLFAGSEKRRIFIIDFGLARKFTDGSGNVQVQARIATPVASTCCGTVAHVSARVRAEARPRWIPLQRSNAAFRGSSKYASIYAHQNEDLGRRDDVWSLFYVLVECLDGALPWTDVRSTAALRLPARRAARQMR